MYDTKSNQSRDEFPSRLRQLREGKGVSRQVLAECCGLSKNIIGQYERGEKTPSIETLVILADFFSTSIDYLLGR